MTADNDNLLDLVFGAVTLPAVSASANKSEVTAQQHPVHHEVSFVESRHVETFTTSHSEELHHSSFSTVEHHQEFVESQHSSTLFNATQTASLLLNGEHRLAELAGADEKRSSVSTHRSSVSEGGPRSFRAHSTASSNATSHTSEDTLTKIDEAVAERASREHSFYEMGNKGSRQASAAGSQPHSRTHSVVSANSHVTESHHSEASDSTLEEHPVQVTAVRSLSSAVQEHVNEIQSEHYDAYADTEPVHHFAIAHELVHEDAHGNIISRESFSIGEPVSNGHAAPEPGQLQRSPLQHDLMRDLQNHAIYQQNQPGDDVSTIISEARVESIPGGSIYTGNVSDSDEDDASCVVILRSMVKKDFDSNEVVAVENPAIKRQPSQVKPLDQQLKNELQAAVQSRVVHDDESEDRHSVASDITDHAHSEHDEHLQQHHETAHNLTSAHHEHSTSMTAHETEMARMLGVQMTCQAQSEDGSSTHCSERLSVHNLQHHEAEHEPEWTPRRFSQSSHESEFVAVGHVKAESDDDQHTLTSQDGIPAHTKTGAYLHRGSNGETHIVTTTTTHEVIVSAHRDSTASSNASVLKTGIYLHRDSTGSAHLVDATHQNVQKTGTCLHRGNDGSSTIQSGSHRDSVASQQSAIGTGAYLHRDSTNNSNIIVGKIAHRDSTVSEQSAPGIGTGAYLHRGSDSSSKIVVGNIMGHRDSTASGTAPHMDNAKAGSFAYRRSSEVSSVAPSEASDFLPADHETASNYSEPQYAQMTGYKRPRGLTGDNYSTVSSVALVPNLAGPRVTEVLRPVRSEDVERSILLESVHEHKEFGTHRDQPHHESHEHHDHDHIEEHNYDEHYHEGHHDEERHLHTEPYTNVHVEEYRAVEETPIYAESVTVGGNIAAAPVTAGGFVATRPKTNYNGMMLPLGEQYLSKEGVGTLRGRWETGNFRGYDTEDEYQSVVRHLDDALKSRTGSVVSSKSSCSTAVTGPKPDVVPKSRTSTVTSCSSATSASSARSKASTVQSNASSATITQKSVASKASKVSNSSYKSHATEASHVSQKSNVSKTSHVSANGNLRSNASSKAPSVVKSRTSTLQHIEEHKELEIGNGVAPEPLNVDIGPPTGPVYAHAPVTSPAYNDKFQSLRVVKSVRQFVQQWGQQDFVAPHIIAAPRVHAVRSPTARPLEEPVPAARMTAPRRESVQSEASVLSDTLSEVSSVSVHSSISQRSVNSQHSRASHKTGSKAPSKVSVPASAPRSVRSVASVRSAGSKHSSKRASVDSNATLTNGDDHHVEVHDHAAEEKLTLEQPHEAAAPLSPAFQEHTATEMNVRAETVVLAELVPVAQRRALFEKLSNDADHNGLHAAPPMVDLLA